MMMVSKWLTQSWNLLITVISSFENCKCETLCFLWVNAWTIALPQEFVQII